MEEDRCPSVTFSPPLWRQRRSFILETLKEHNVKTVLDYGCGEAAVLAFLAGDYVPFLKLTGLDVCEEALNEAVERCQPHDEDFKRLREQPLIIDIYKGSIDEPDVRLMGHDAIICTEVIEHVEPHVLTSFFKVVLGNYAPQVLVVTTPNAEYNVHFPALQYGKPNATFRHDDHKFEWTRKEFQAWCTQGANEYSYTTQFRGIGLLDGMAHITENGHSTQACIFTRIDNTALPRTVSTLCSEPHQLIKHIEFPYYNQPLLPEASILEKIEYFIQSTYDYSEIDSQGDSPSVNLHEYTDSSIPNSVSSMPTSSTSIEGKLTRWTRTPMRLPLSYLWNILDVRQVCKSRERMIEILLKQYDSYALQGDELIVNKAFPLIQEEEDEEVKEDGEKHDDYSDDDDYDYDYDYDYGCDNNYNVNDDNTADGQLCRSDIVTPIK